MPRHRPDEQLLIDSGFDVVALIVRELDYDLHTKLFEAISQTQGVTHDITSAKALVIREVLGGVEGSRQFQVGGTPYFSGFSAGQEGLEVGYAIGDLLRTHRPSQCDETFRSVCRSAVEAHMAMVDRIGEDDE
ncbi:MAG: hypothetical protein K5831_17070 [Brevundimonas sp.]|uniref:hypothetical protein n=1 Tax=Brevundimonas sp. TaxID=1871086 RepID=UPI00258E58E2|nr:hypothetical protein [Brevundimonas sp.]MCV0416575.1 hypothetical protein [Brevundimonas sp.]